MATLSGTKRKEVVQDPTLNKRPKSDEKEKKATDDKEHTIFSPLHIAVWNDDALFANKLIRGGYDVNVKDVKGIGCLNYNVYLFPFSL